MKFELFAATVREAAARLPRRFKQALANENIKIIPREQVPDAIRQKYSKTVVLGIFIGISRKDAGAFVMQTEPTRIEIYQESFEQAFGDEMTKNLREEIYRTVIHEVAHYFGFDEGQISKRGF